MLVLPDRRWLGKQILIVATLTAMVFGVGGVAFTIVTLTSDPGDWARGVVSRSWDVALWVIVALWIVALPAAAVRSRNLEYVVEPDKIVIRRGVLTKVQQTIPLRMVSDFRLHRSPYDRLLGIGSIQIRTAGQGRGATGSRAVLNGLADWAAFHEGLRNRLRSESLPAADDLWRDLGEIEDIHALLDEVREIRKVIESGR